jgi:hypothetical protein
MVPGIYTQRRWGVEGLKDGRWASPPKPRFSGSASGI